MVAGAPAPRRENVPRHILFYSPDYIALQKIFIEIR